MYSFCFQHSICFSRVSASQEEGEELVRSDSPSTSSSYFLTMTTHVPLIFMEFARGYYVVPRSSPLKRLVPAQHWIPFKDPRLSWRPLTCILVIPRHCAMLGCRTLSTTVPVHLLSRHFGRTLWGHTVRGGVQSISVQMLHASMC